MRVLEPDVVRVQVEVEKELENCKETDISMVLNVPPRHVLACLCTCSNGKVNLVLNLAGAAVVSVKVERRSKVLSVELAQLRILTGETEIARVQAHQAVPLTSPFTGEVLQNTDVASLQTEASDRVCRHVMGNYLNSDKGFAFRFSAGSKKKESPMVIGPVPRMVVRLERKILKTAQQAKWALKQAGVIFGPWDVAFPAKHVLFGMRVWVTPVHMAKSTVWAAVVEVFKLKPWRLSNGASLGLPVLADGVRRNALLSPDGAHEMKADAFGIDAFGDVRSLHAGRVVSAESKRTGSKEIQFAFRQRLTPLYKSFTRGFYPFDAGDLNPYKWVTFYARASAAFEKLSPEEKAQLERSEGKCHTSNFQLGEVSQSLKAALLDKFFGGREAALKAIGTAFSTRKISIQSIVPPECELTLHGVGATPLRPMKVSVKSVAVPGGGVTRNVQDRRPVESVKVEIMQGKVSANAEGEDQLWRHAIEEAKSGVGSGFLAYISDTDFKVAALVIMPIHLFLEDGAAPGIGRVMQASVDRSAPQHEQYWCMNELVSAVAILPILVEAIVGGPAPLSLTEAAAKRVRCAHVAAAIVLMGGDTTPSIHGLTEPIGLRGAIMWVWYTGALVEICVRDGHEVFRLLPEAVARLHKVWYVLRSTPNIQKLVDYKNRSRPSQQQWLNALTYEKISTAVLQKVPPVGVAGQPVRSAANLKVIIIVANARLLQWCLSTNPDPTLFEARDGLSAVEGKSCGPMTTLLDWDLSGVSEGRGKRARKEAAAAANNVQKPAMLQASELFQTYQNDLRDIDSLPGKPKNERRALLENQLVARGGDRKDYKGLSWQRLKQLLLAALHEEAPPTGATAVEAAAEAEVNPTAKATETDVVMTPAPREQDPSAETGGCITEADVAMTPAPEPEQPSAEDGGDFEENDDDPLDYQSDSEASETSNFEHEVAGQRAIFFCCADNKLTGGWWHCPSCSKCFHNKCNASATNDRANPVCKPCHAGMLSSTSKTTRTTTRQRTN